MMAMAAGERINAVCYDVKVSHVIIEVEIYEEECHN